MTQFGNMVFQTSFFSHILDRLLGETDILIRSHLCSRVRYPRSDCRLCQENCPSNAIVIEGDTVSINENCSGCEICIPACPNGVFTLTGENEKKRRLHLKAKLKENPVARFSCIMDKEKEKEGALVVPCLAGLSEGYLMAPFAWGGKHVQIKRIECEQCPFVSGMNQYEQLIRETRRLLNCFGLSGDLIEEVEKFVPHPGSCTGEDASSQDKVGRREFFDLFRVRTLKATRQLLPEPEKDLEELRWSQQENPLRTFLLEILPQLGEIEDETFNTESLHVHDISISEACTGCNVCEKLCPAGAMRREEHEETTRLIFTLSRCTGCKICGQACFSKAISYSKAIPFKDFVFGTDRERVRVKAKHCSVCGNPFQGLPGEMCPQCLGSHRRGSRL